MTRIEDLGDILADPASFAPPDTALEHLLFALKHENTNLPVLAAACTHLEPSALLAELRRPASFTPGPLAMAMVRLPLRETRVCRE